MKDISLHILDIIQNSISAKATLIEVYIDTNYFTDTYKITITDNGKGINPEMLKTVTDPYTTTRKTRRVGLGIPLLKMNAELSGGSFSISSQVNKGTTLQACFKPQHIDCLPEGDIPGTILLLVTTNPNIDFIYNYTTPKGTYNFDTRQIKQILQDIPITQPEVRKHIKQMLIENIERLK